MARTRPRAFQVRLTEDELERWCEHVHATERPSVAGLVRDAVERLMAEEEAEQVAEILERSGEPASGLAAELDEIARAFGQ
jgi:hypothetical protein